MNNPYVLLTVGAVLLLLVWILLWAKRQLILSQLYNIWTPDKEEQKKEIKKIDAVVLLWSKPPEDFEGKNHVYAKNLRKARYFLKKIYGDTYRLKYDGIEEMSPELLGQIRACHPSHWTPDAQHLVNFGKIVHYSHDFEEFAYLLIWVSISTEKVDAILLGVA